MRRDRGKSRLLIVDDQPANVRVLAEILKAEHELTFATHGEMALQRAAAGDVDLVLLDVVMPGMDGFEVCRRLKEDPRTASLPVIFVTVSDEMEDEARGFDLGAVDYITKPVKPPIVRARVRTHLELKQARELLEEMAWVDALTGIPNRRRFDAALESEWQRASRAGRPLSIALLDVDFFKKYNDTYGHARGDDCLRAVAGALSGSVLRPGDLVARYGGEEFGILAPETDADGMRLLVESLVARVADLGIDHRTSQCAAHVTVSVGAVTLQPAPSQAPAAALEAADRLLYQAKAGGRARGVHDDLRTAAQAALLEGGLP
jgi:diguanylate cyclase (GGDEF)-like protein